MILDVYYAFFLPVSRCSRSVSSRLAIISRIAQKFPLLDDVLVRSSLGCGLKVASRILPIFSTRATWFRCSIFFSDTYRNVKWREDKPPHIYGAVADRLYQDMLELRSTDAKNQ
ncbi:hypothetical protein LSAT2_010121 [Lamellibrachia satsuma]|nr:hypothetical protein LSAT2_010121 [Lamellibrachia satsuma]